LLYNNLLNLSPATSLVVTKFAHSSGIIAHPALTAIIYSLKGLSAISFMSCKKVLLLGQVWWLILVISTIQEVEIGGSRSQSSPRQKCEILSEKIKQKGMEVWLK
jgi:hypothetical protein